MYEGESGKTNLKRDVPVQEPSPRKLPESVMPRHGT